MLSGNPSELLHLQDLTWLAGVTFIGITSLIQAFSKKFSPWTWMLEQIGKSINKESLEKLKEINDKVTKLEEWNVKQDNELQLSEVKSARRRILICADEICNRLDKWHTEEYFNEILDDIKMYIRYCEEHPEFENEKAVASIKIIRETYEECLRENKFARGGKVHGNT